MSKHSGITCIAQLCKKCKKRGNGEGRTRDLEITLTLRVGILDSRANQLRHTPLLSVETNAPEIDYKPPYVHIAGD